MSTKKSFLNYTDDAAHSDAGNWIVHVEPGEPNNLADYVSLTMVIKNRGPGAVLLSTREGHAVKIFPGALRVSDVNCSCITLECFENESATVALQFMPRSPK
jgi:hypothetical protein